MTTKTKPAPKSTVTKQPQSELDKGKPSPLERLIQETGTEVAAVNKYVNDVVKKMDILKAALAYVRIDQLADSLALVAKAFNAIRDDIAEHILPEKFESAGMKTLPFNDLGVRVTVSDLLRVSIPKGNKDKAYQWLRDNDLGDLITDTVNSSTLTATINNLLKENKAVDEEIFNIAIMKSTSVTKLGKKTNIKSATN